MEIDMDRRGFSSENCKSCKTTHESNHFTCSDNTYKGQKMGPHNGLKDGDLLCRHNIGHPKRMDKRVGVDYQKSPQKVWDESGFRYGFKQDVYQRHYR